MKNSTKFSVIFASSFLVLGVLTITAIQNKSFLTLTNANIYQLSLNSGTNKLDFGNNTCNIKTISGYDIPLSYSGLSSSEGNVAKLANGAFIMNQSKIKSMTSMEANFTGELKILYAWEDTTMLVEDELTSGVAYTFKDKSPSYFKLVNESGNDVVLNSIDIRYSCEDTIKKVVKINYLKKSDSTVLTEPTYLILDEGEIYGGEGVSGKGAITVGETKYLPNRYWVGGKCDENKEVNITYTPASVYDGTISESLTGTGTEADPYQINSAADLAYLESSTHGLGANKSTGNVDTYYVLNTSIDMTGYDWTGICNRKVTTTSYSYFNANFDGQGYTIGGLTTPENCNYTAIGFISCTNAATQIKNFTLEGNFQANSTRLGGGLSYYPRNTTFTNIYSFVNFEVIEPTASKQYAACLIGSVSTNSVVQNCESYGTVIGGQYTGGIAGTANGDIIDCINYGKVSTSTSSSIGGIAGMTKGIITGCTNYGEVESTFTGGSNGAQAGGIVGSTTGGKVYESTNYGYVHATLKGVGGIVGWHTTSSICYNCANGGVIESNAKNTTGSILGYCGSGSHAYGYTTDATEEYAACYNLVGARVLGVTYPTEGEFIVVGVDNNGGGTIKI